MVDIQVLRVTQRSFSPGRKFNPAVPSGACKRAGPASSPGQGLSR
jgi:hypothetical protein